MKRRMRAHSAQEREGSSPICGVPVYRLVPTYRGPQMILLYWLALPVVYFGAQRPKSANEIPRPLTLAVNVPSLR